MFFLKGLLIGFAIAAPVGPIGVLVIRRTFAEGRAAGLATGLGAATADALYGLVAALGLTSVSRVLIGWQYPMQLFGGVFMVGLGLHFFLSKPSSAAPRVQGRGGLAAWATTVLLTLANPATILSFAAVFAGAGLAQGASGPLAALALVLGVFGGSAAWWYLLANGVSQWRERYPEFAAMAPNPFGGALVTGITMGMGARKLRRVNQGSGLVLVAFGLWALLSAIGAV